MSDGNRDGRINTWYKRPSLDGKRHLRTLFSMRSSMDLHQDRDLNYELNIVKIALIGHILISRCRSPSLREVAGRDGS